MRRSRGVFHAVYSALLDDPDWLRLSPHARFVFLTMRVSKEAGPACIWCCYPGTVAMQTGLSEAVVRRSMSMLEQGKWIAIEYPLTWVVNGLRYDPFYSLANPNHRTAIEKWLKSLPKLALVLRFCDYYQLPYPFDTHPDTHSDPIAMGMPINKNKVLSTKYEEKLNYVMSGNDARPRHDQESLNGLRATARDLLAFLNKKSNRQYQAVESNLKLLVALLRKGTTPAQIRAVIGLRAAKWKGDPKMEEFLRPKTLFTATNFANYVGELPASAFEAPPDA